MILLWRADTSSGTYTRSHIKDLLKLKDPGLKPGKCEPAPKRLPPLTLEITSKTEPVDFFLAGSYFVASEALRNVLEGFSVKAEFLPLKTIFKKKPYSAKKFYVVNILDSVECFDFKKSEYETIPEGVVAIEKLVLINSKAKGHHLFMVGQIMTNRPNPKAVSCLCPCASEELALAVLDAGIPGVVFVKPINERIYPPPDWRTA